MPGTSDAALHPIMLRQLRRSLGVDGVAALHALPALAADAPLAQSLARLVTMVSESYDQFDRDLTLRTRSLELSSQELTQVNDRLRAEAVAQRTVLDTLRESARELLPHRLPADVAAPQSDDLLELATLLRALVHQSREAELALADSERKFRGLVANLPGCVYRRGAGRDGTVMFLSEGIQQLTGYPAQAFTGQGQDLAALVLPEDLPRMRRQIIRATRRHVGYEVEYRIRHADGSVRWALDRGQGVYDADGGLLYFDGLVLDRTQTRLAQEQSARAQAQLQSALESLDAGFVMYDEQDRLVVCNSRYRQVSPIVGLGPHPTIHEVMRSFYRSGLEGIDRSLSEDVWLDGRIALHRALDAGPRVREVTLGGRWYQVHESRSRDGLTVSLRTDITESRRLNQDLREAKDAAEDASRAKTRFLANMSHELRTPLNAVIGAAQLLQAANVDTGESASSVDAGQAHLVESIQRSGLNLLGLIENILDLSRIEAGEFTLSMEDFHLLDCVDAAMATAAVTARAKGLELSCIVDPALAPWRHGDPLRVRQVLLNLLGNAVKFTPAGDITVRLACGDRPDQLRISIADTGVGIGEASLQHIFEPFRQADDGANRRFGGSGLGLSIVRQLVEAMDGRITVRSRLGEGTCFDLLLRMEPAGQPPLAPPALGLDVGFYDPHDPSAEALATQLHRLGCTTTRLHSAQEAGGWLAAITRPAQAWMLVSCDGAESGVLLDRADGCPLAGRVLGMTSRQDNDGCVRLGIRTLVRNLMKPVLRTALVSEFGTLAGGRRSGNAHTMTAEAGGSPAARAHVLVVEDDPLNQTIVCRLLGHAGYLSTAATDGAQALDLLRARTFDLVLMDWQMPDMDGLEVTRRIRAGDAGPGPALLPIVALTANAFAQDRVACLAAGMNDFLTKPVLAENLRTMVSRWVARGPGGGAQPLSDLQPQAQGLVAASTAAELPVPAPGDVPCFDPSALAELPMIEDGSDPGYADELLDMFVADARVLIARIDADLARGDPEGTMRGAHTLKSTASAVGAMAIAALAADGESALRSGGQPGAGFAAALERALAAFERLLATERARGAATGRHWLVIPG